MIKPSKQIKTGIRETFSAHQVYFTIDHQTFFLAETQPEEGTSSEDMAKWYEKQLQAALTRLDQKYDLQKAKILKAHSHVSYAAGLMDAAGLRTNGIDKAIELLQETLDDGKGNTD